MGLHSVLGDAAGVPIAGSVERLGPDDLARPDQLDDELPVVAVVGCRGAQPDHLRLGDPVGEPARMDEHGR